MTTEDKPNIFVASNGARFHNRDVEQHGNIILVPERRVDPRNFDQLSNEVFNILALNAKEGDYILIDQSATVLMLMLDWFRLYNITLNVLERDILVYGYNHYESTEFIQWTSRLLQ